jgi:hypothetical protein
LKKIWITTEFEGKHFWAGASGEQYFLKFPHRHLFKVRVDISVNENDREIEFFAFKNEVNNFISQLILCEDYLGSCEMIAEKLHEIIRSKYSKRKISVSISEDGENGAVISNE